MKRFLFPFSLILNAVGAIYIFNISQPVHKNQALTTAKGPSKNIVIISPAIHPSLEKIEQGIITSIKKDIPAANISVMNANGKQTLLLAQVQEAVNAKPDAIVTIASQPTQIARELLKKRGSSIPLVFAAVTSPQTADLAYHPQELTGISDKPDYTFTSEILHHLAPNIRSLLLVYNPTESSSLEQERIELESALHTHSIELTPLEIFQTSEIAQKTKNLITKHDAVIILKDNSVASGLDALAKLCDQHGKLLITHDLDSADRGAGLSFGIFEEASGLEAGYIVAQFLNKTISQLPEIGRVTDNHVKINISAATRQNLTINPVELALLRSIIVV